MGLCIPKKIKEPTEEEIDKQRDDLVVKVKQNIQNVKSQVRRQEKEIEKYHKKAKETIKTDKNKCKIYLSLKHLSMKQAESYMEQQTLFENLLQEFRSIKDIKEMNQAMQETINQYKKLEETIDLSEIQYILDKMDQGASSLREMCKEGLENQVEDEYNELLAEIMDEEADNLPQIQFEQNKQQQKTQKQKLAISQ